MSDKAVDFAEFNALFIGALNRDEENKFVQFRWDYAMLGAYVIEHAYTLWMAHYDKWDTVAAFAFNYAIVVEGSENGKTAKITKWVEHANIVRSLIIGA